MVAVAVLQAMSKGGTKTDMKDRFVKILEDKRKVKTAEPLAEDRVNQLTFG